MKPIHSRGVPAYPGFFSRPVANLLEEFLETPSSFTKHMISGDSYPPMDILKGKNGFEIRVAVAGIDKKYLTCEIENNCLVISHKKPPPDNSSETMMDSPTHLYALEHVHQEIKQSNFEKRLKLGDAIDIDQIESKYENGLIIVRLPLKENVTHTKKLDL